MKTIGLIAEYNPLHLGHIYQIKKIKELYKDSIIILITNSCFTQRGNVQIINKWDKTKIALDNNIDIVIELPFIFATQSADTFAEKSIEILNHLKIDTLVFGSECNDIEYLTKIAKEQLYNNKYDELVKKYIDTGINYPTALNKALKELNINTTNQPNDLLGISYIKAILKNNYNITPITIKRTNEYHSKKIKGKIISATAIREKIKNKKKIKKYIPRKTEKYIDKNININQYYEYLKYKIIETNNLEQYLTVDEGIQNRIKKEINNSKTWDELTNNIKTKRYTYNKINRMLIHILTSLTKEEAKNKEINYIRLLGLNSKGKNYINKIKKDIKVPIITNYKKNISNILDIELRITKIYDLVKKDNLIEAEFKNKPIIKETK